jgi:flavin-binding protein dodecin
VYLASHRVEGDAMVYKKIDLIGRSNESFEDAVDDAVSRAEETLDNLMWVSVMNQAVELDQPEREYQTEVEVAFELEDGVGE